MPTTDIINYSTLGAIEDVHETRNQVADQAQDKEGADSGKIATRHLAMKLVAPNIDAAAKKVLAMLAPVKRGKSKPNESPMTAQKVQNRALGGR